MFGISRSIGTGIIVFRNLAVAILFLVPIAASADESLTAEAKAAVGAFIDAVASGERQQLAPLLAPEYQIMRSNGVGYDRPGYLDEGAPSVKILSPSHADDIVATRTDDVMVVRYFLSVDETIDGQRVDRRAPRLTVFRKSGDLWLVVAHGNFGVSN